MGGTAWVTLATNDSYSLGALVLAHSLLKVNTVHKLAVLITPAVSPTMREQLSTVFDVVKVVDVLDSKDETNLALLKRPELGITFTKLHCWTLTDFDKGVFLDADTLVVRNSDELFERDEFSAAPDVGWPDCFNSGVFVFRPSIDTFNKLVQFAVEKGSFDGGDQGLLNQYFNEWATDDIRKHLPFVYNLTSVAVYSYIPAFKQYGSDTRIIHFIGPVKPWLQPVDPDTRTVHPAPESAHLLPLLQHWWDIFIEKVHPNLSANLDLTSGMLHIFAQLECLPDPLEPSLPAFPEPYTPYIEIDDARQYNLPYQPFQVVSHEGELLNITFADFVKETEKENHSDVPEPENEEPPPPPEPELTEVLEKIEELVPTVETEPVFEPPPENQFDYYRFVPDETCISAYLEHNVQQYQPHEDYEAPPQQWEEPLPRFLTIPEDDPRQGHVVYQREPSPERHEEQVWVPWEMPQEHQRSTSPGPDAPTLPRSKSMSNLVFDATDGSQGLSHWKSQPDVTPIATKKLPGLKPLKPKDKTPTKLQTTPKYTEFTEFFMSDQHRDPFAPPADKIGFVERAILKRATSRKGMFNIPQGGLEPDPSPVVLQAPSPKLQIEPEMNEYVDIDACLRQAGNSPKPESKIEKKKIIKPRSGLRRGKRSVRKHVEALKPSEPSILSYDVDAILQRLSTLSTGYAAIVPPAPKEPVEVENEPVLQKPVFKERSPTPQPLEKTSVEQLFRNNPPKGGVDIAVPTGESVGSDSDKFVAIEANACSAGRSRRFGPVEGMQPLVTKVSRFAAPMGHSLSESEGLVPEIVVCAPTPIEECSTPDERVWTPRPVDDCVIRTTTAAKVVDNPPVLINSAINVSAATSEKLAQEVVDPVVEEPVVVLKAVDAVACAPELENIKSTADEIVDPTPAETIKTSTPVKVLDETYVIDSNGDDRSKSASEYDPQMVAEVPKINGTNTEEIISAMEKLAIVRNGVGGQPIGVETIVEHSVVEKQYELFAENVILPSDREKKKFNEVPELNLSVNNAECGDSSASEVFDSVIDTIYSSPMSSETFVSCEEVAECPTDEQLPLGQNIPEKMAELDLDLACQQALDASFDAVLDEVKKKTEEFSDQVERKFGDLDTSSPSKVYPFSFNNGINKTPLPPVPEPLRELSYAAAAKKEISEVPRVVKEPTAVFILPSLPQQAQPQSLKRPRKQVKKLPVDVCKPSTSSQATPSPPIKYTKRKSEKSEVEPPANRFQVLPEEKLPQTVFRKKKTHKPSRKFASPSSSLPLSLPSSAHSNSIVPAQAEEIDYLPQPDDIPGIVGAIAQLTLDPTSSVSSPGRSDSAAQAEYLRRQSWETGKMDYMGRDSFANIWSKITDTLAQQSVPENPNSPGPASSPDPQ